jgi:apolipoprotein N-acyltransferase
MRAGAMFAGALPSLAFPELNWWWIAFVALVPLLLVLVASPDPREAGIRGWLGGTGFLLATHHWLVFKLGPFLPVAALLVGALWAPWGWAAYRLLARRSIRAVLAAAGVLASGWVLFEVIRSWEPLGGPFGLIGSSQWRNQAFLSPAAIGGVWAVGFLIVWINVCISAAIVSPTALRTRVAGAVAAACALAVGPVYDTVRPEPDYSGRVKVATVQVGVVDDPQRRFDAGLEFTSGLTASDIDIVLWGESSVGTDFERSPDLLERVRDAAADLDADILVNVDALRSRGGGIFKSSVLVTSEGIVGTYNKTRLVPFGEYIPLRPVLGWIDEITEAADIDRRRGRGPRLLQSSGLALGPLVCFESAFPDMSRALADMGADLIVFQSATTTFQDSWAPEQHASLAAVRAMETGRPTVHATLTGTTAAFDARANRLTWMGTNENGANVFDVPLVEGETLYTRFGEWVPIASGAVVLIAGVATLVARRRSAMEPDRPAKTSL